MYEPILVKHLEGYPFRHPPLELKYSGDVGVDLMCNIAEPLVLGPRDFNDIPTGIAIKIPNNTWAMIRPRSSAFFKHRIFVFDGTIDSGYTGELYIGVWNLLDEDVVVMPQCRLAQIVLLPKIPHQIPVIVEELPETSRGEKGFGSSGN